MATPPTARSGIAIAADNIRDAVAILRLSMSDAAAADVLAELARSAFDVPVAKHEQPASQGAAASSSEGGAAHGQNKSKPDKLPRRRSLDTKTRQLEARLNRLNIAKEGLKEASKNEAKPTDSAHVAAEQPPTEPEPVHHPAYHPDEQPTPPPLSTPARNPPHKRTTEDAPELSPLTTPTRMPSAEKRLKQKGPLSPIQFMLEGSDHAHKVADSSIGLEARLFAKEAVHRSRWCPLENSEHISTYERGLHLLTMAIKNEKREDWPIVIKAQCDRTLRMQCRKDGVSEASWVG